MSTDKAWVGLTVQKLEKRFVRRVSDKQDGRRTLVSLTRQGKDVHDVILANAKRRQRRRLAALGEKDAETVIAGLE